MTNDPVTASTHVRVARPSRHLAAAHRFYVDGLGLDALWHSTERVSGKRDLLMVGPAGGGWHCGSPSTRNAL